MAGLLDQLDIANNQVFLGHYDELIEWSRPMLDMFDAEQKVVDKPGREIKETVHYKRLPGGSYQYYEPLNTDAVEQVSEVTETWTQNYVTVSISEQEIIENIGVNLDSLMGMSAIRDIGGEKATTLVNLLSDKMKTAPNDLAERRALILLSDGTYENAEVMNGLVNIIEDNTSDLHGKAVAAFGTDRRTASSNFWASHIKDCSGEVLNFDHIKDIRWKVCSRGRIKTGKNGKAETIKAYCNADVYGFLELVLQQQVQYKPGENGEIGVPSITWRGLEFIEDTLVEDGDIWLINHRLLKSIKDPALMNHWGKWEKPVGQRALTKQYLCREQMFTWDRHAHGMIKNFVVD